MPAAPPAPPLTVREAAAALRVSERAVRQWVADGTLPAYRLGARGKRGTIRVARADLDALLAASRVAGDPARPAAAERARATPRSEIKCLKL